MPEDLPLTFSVKQEIVILCLGFVLRCGLCPIYVIKDTAGTTMLGFMCSGCECALTDSTITGGLPEVPATAETQSW